MEIYKAIVEDNTDPIKAGRVRIRVFGIHTPSKNKSETDGIPTNELPWAIVAQSTSSSASTGVGIWNVPSKGSLVLAMSEDEGLQRWIVLATLPGIPREAADTSLGFADPSGEFPIESRLGAPDWNRLARNDKVSTDTIVAIKTTEILKKIPVSSLAILGTDFGTLVKPVSAGSTYEEPKEPYATEYPDNMVLESNPKTWLNGHVMEFDDTSGKERLTMWHKAGTFFSIHYDGQWLKKCISDSFEIVMGTTYEYFNNDRFQTVWGDEKILVRSNKQTEVFGYNRDYVKGSDVKYVSGDYALWIGAEMPDDPTKTEYTLQTRKKDGSLPVVPDKDVPKITERKGDFNLKIEQNHHEYVKGNLHNTIDGTYYVEVTGTRNISKNQVGDPGDYNLNIHGEVLVKAQDNIKLNGGRQFIDFGVLHSLAFCPIIGTHTCGSSTVKVTL